MGRLPEPDDVDIVVDGRNSDPESLRETTEYIKAYKSRPEYAEEVREAKRILDAFRLNSPNYTPPDPDALLEEWKRTAEELKKRGLNGSPESAIGLEANESR
jgi:hypothetical protein